MGLAHDENDPLSRLQLNVLFASLEVKLNVALVLLLGDGGPDVMKVSGGGTADVREINLRAKTPSVQRFPLPVGSLSVYK